MNFKHFVIVAVLFIGCAKYDFTGNETCKNFLRAIAECETRRPFVYASNYSWVCPEETFENAGEWNCSWDSYFQSCLDNLHCLEDGSWYTECYYTCK